jgi:hypothetical protein
VIPVLVHPVLMDGNWKATNQEHIIILHPAVIDGNSQANQSETHHSASSRGDER